MNPICFSWTNFCSSPSLEKTTIFFFIPIYSANFVLMEYGTGAIMAVPAHDQRDYEFAKKYKIPLKVVINPDGAPFDPATMKEAYVDDGILTNSGEFNGMNNRGAIPAINTWLTKKKFGKTRT